MGRTGTKTETKRSAPTVKGKVTKPQNVSKRRRTKRKRQTLQKQAPLAGPLVRQQRPTLLLQKTTTSSSSIPPHLQNPNASATHGWPLQRMISSNFLTPICPTMLIMTSLPTLSPFPDSTIYLLRITSMPTRKKRKNSSSIPVHPRSCALIATGFTSSTPFPPQS